MKIFGYTIIKTACYEAEKKRVERMTLGFQQEQASNNRCIEHLLEKIARLEEGSDEIKKAMEFMPKGMDVVESFKLLQQFLFSIPKGMDVVESFKLLQQFLFSIPKDMSIELVLKKVQER